MLYQGRKIKLSVVVPVYNEADRITKTIVSLREYFKDKQFEYEIVVVDDGSQDTTVDLVRGYLEEWSNLRMIRLEKNKGKGAAVKTGMLAARGEWILFMDADSSTDIVEIEKFWSWTGEYDVIIGSRYLEAGSLKKSQPWYRQAVGRLGNAMIQILLVPGIVDTQCGFKLFSRKAARDLFSRLRSERWSFDLEVLATAGVLSYPIKEVPVDWYDSPHGRVNLLSDSVKFLIDLFKIKYWVSNLVSAEKKDLSVKKVNYHLYLMIVIIFFGLIYAIFSLVPHYRFDTNAYDLGIFNQTIYQYAHFKLEPNTIRDVPILLADHFELMLFPFSLSYWIFGSYALLLVQIASIIFGGTGIYLLVGKETKNVGYGLLAAIVFYSYFTVFDALSFDYHNDVVGWMLVPWLFYVLSIRRMRWYYILLIMCMFFKETMPLITAFLGISIILFESREIKKHGWITLFVSVVYFLVVLKLIITVFNGGGYDHIVSYSHLGSSLAEIAWNMISQPWCFLAMLFDHSTKLKMWVLLFLSGGVLAILKPKYFILLIPVLAQKFFSQNPSYWTHTFHYLIGLAPIVVLGASMAIYTYFQSDRVRRYFFIGLVVVNLIILGGVKFYDGSNIWRIFSAEYYRLSPNLQASSEALKIIPDGASVSATNGLVSHLANRDEIYFYPTVEQADYVVLNEEDFAGWNQEIAKLSLEVKERDLDGGEEYRVIFEQDGVAVYERQMIDN